MNIRVVNENDALTHIALEGRLDTAGVQDIELHFLAHTAARGKPTLIDMRGVEYVSSLGIRLILSAMQTLKKKGTKGLLFAVQPLVKETLVLAGLDDLLASSDNEEEVIRSLTPRP